MKIVHTRRKFLAGAGAAAGLLSSGGRALAARPYTIKLGLDVPLEHPAAQHAIAVGKRIAAESKGRITLKTFPASQLGDDTHMLSEVLSGAMEMMCAGDNILSSLVPTVAVDNIGFAFKTVEDAWAALDGKLGGLVCADIMKAGLYPMRQVWDEGFRQVTTNTKPILSPADLAGFKIRVPPSPISVSLFQSLGASAVSLNLSELYTSLQTKVVDGQENPLGMIETQKFYQVQKYCSLTNHMWVGYWMVANNAFWNAMPEDDRKLIETAFNDQAAKQRAANNALNNSLQANLTSQGMAFNTINPDAFRQVLVKAGFYTKWQQKFGDEIWSTLEATTGKLG